VNQEFTQQLNSRLKSTEHVRSKISISKSLVYNIISKLKSGKAAGADGICSDHLKNASDLLMDHLALLFQICISQRIVPSNFCVGITTTILKKNKDAALCNSYRPITVSSLFSKVFEKLLLPSIASKCLVGSKQLGFRTHVGCATAHLIIRTIIAQVSRNRNRWYPSLGKFGVGKENSNGYRLL
jgi:hypothetical protein